jgi:phosphoglycerate dehydrogenase-like enzyme
VQRLKGLFVLDSQSFEETYGPEERRDISRLIEIPPIAHTSELIWKHPAQLAEMEVLFTGWGGPRLNARFLEAAPKLKVVFYGAGTIVPIMTELAWNRGIQISSAYAANAVPVAEFSLGMILLALKHTWQYARKVRTMRGRPAHLPVPGCYGSTVGLVSLGMTGRTVLRLLKPFDLHVISHDPHVSQEEAAELGVQLFSLDELFRRSDVISLHTPWLKETEGLITGNHLSLMKYGATIINTARGILIRETEMIQVLTDRPDLQAILDVTDPEPPVGSSPLYDLPNLLLTPHIAGSMSNECRRMGRYMVEELGRYVRAEPLMWEITPETARRTIHRPPTMETVINKQVIADAKRAAMSRKP